MTDNSPQELYEEYRIDPEKVHRYRSASGEYNEMLAVTLARLNGSSVSSDPGKFNIDDMPEIRIRGPTGCGKTTAARNLAVDIQRAVTLKENGYPVLDRDGLIEAAQEDGVSFERATEDLLLKDVIQTVSDELFGQPDEGLPYFDITLAHATNPADLKGHPDVNSDGSTQFIEGTMTKAVKASKVGPIVLLLDEVNRAPTEGKDELYDALDHRTRVTLEGIRGGQTIKGDNLNLLAVSTMNYGQGHHVEPMDTAEKRRLGATFETSYLGYNPNGENTPQPEVELVADRTPASETTGEKLVRAANEIRNLAESDSQVRYGVPTSNVLDWARTAFAYHNAGIDDPVLKAGKSTVARAIYDHNQDEVDEVASTLQTEVGSMPFNAEEHEAWKDDSDRLACEDCSWSAPVDEAPEDAVNFLDCPECEAGRLSSFNN